MILQYVAVKQIILYDFIDKYMHKKLPRRMKVWDRSAVGINWKINDWRPFKVWPIPCSLLGVPNVQKKLDKMI